MSKIVHGDRFPKQAKIKFMNKRDTIQETLDGTIKYYDWCETMQIIKKTPCAIRYLIDKHRTLNGDYYTVETRKDAENTYVEIYMERR